MVTITGLLKTLSPLCQSSPPPEGQKSSNIMTIQESTFLLRESDESPSWIAKRYPTLTGNGLRGRLRDIAAEQLLALLGYPVTAKRPTVLDFQGHPSLPPLTENLFIFLFAGGHLGKDGDTKGDPGLFKATVDAVPMVRLFGGVGQGQWIPHRFTVSEAIPTVAALRDFCTPWAGPADVLDAAFRSIPDERELKQIQRFARFSHPHQTFAQPKEKDENGKTKKEDSGLGMMPYGVESVVAGVPFYHQIVIYDDDPLALGVVAYALQTFAQRGQFGGKAAVGFGRLSAQYWTDQGDRIDASGATGRAAEAIDAYIAYVRENAGAIYDALKIYDRPPKKKDNPAKKKGDNAPEDDTAAQDDAE